MEAVSTRGGKWGERDEKKDEQRKETHCVTLLVDKLFGGASDVVRTAERT